MTVAEKAERAVRAIADALEAYNARQRRGTVADCERDMRRMSSGERGCSNPVEHAR